MLRNSRPPIEAGSVEAPITAIERGKNRGRIEAATAALLPLPFRLKHPFALGYREIDGEDAFVDGAGQLIAGVAEEPHHLPVLRQDEGLESLHPL